MENLIIYWLKVNVIISVFFLAYLVLFKNEKRFQINRAYFLGAMIIPFLLPLLPHLSGYSLNSRIDFLNPFANMYRDIGDAYTEPAAKGIINHLPLKPGIYELNTYKSILMAFLIYLTIATILFMRFLTQILNLYMLVKANRCYEKDGINYCEHDRPLNPFSFFKYLVLNVSKYSGSDLQQIIAHEKVHMKEWHSADVLLAEIVHILLWINPVMIYFKRYLKLNLEYIADEKVLAAGFDKREYQLSILQNSIKPAVYPLTNLYNSSKIKHRITMINKNQTPAKGLYKYAIVLPLFLAAWFLVNTTNASPAMFKTSKELLKLTELKQFEGFYALESNQATVFKVSASPEGLIAKNMWNDKETLLKQVSDLQFKSEDPQQPFVVDFIRDNSGAVIKAQVIDGGLWIKVKDYRPAVIAEVKLSREQLKRLEGTYQFENNKQAYLQISATENGLTLKQLWDGKEITFFATSEHEFNSRQLGSPFPLKFSKDANGKVTGLVAFKDDKWDRVEK